MPDDNHTTPTPSSSVPDDRASPQSTQSANPAPETPADPDSQSPVDRWKARREEEKANQDPSLYRELFASRDEDGNKRPPLSRRFEDYTRNTVKRQQAEQARQDENPPDPHRFLMVVGIIIILLLFLVVLGQCQAVSGTPVSTGRLSLTGAVQEIFSGLQTLLPQLRT